MEETKLQSQQLKKKKLPKWLLILIATPLVIIALHFHFYSALKEEFHADESVNPEATSYFLHATAINTVWISVLHDFLFIDYDNLLLKPFLSLRDYFFEQGEASMPSDNAEDAIWWIQNYASMYDFTVTGRDDKSMAIDTLDEPMQRIIREKIYHYIIKMDKYGIRGIHSNKYAIPTDKMTEWAGGGVEWGSVALGLYSKKKLIISCLVKDDEYYNQMIAILEMVSNNKNLRNFSLRDGKRKLKLGEKNG